MFFDPAITEVTVVAQTFWCMDEFTLIIGLGQIGPSCLDRQKVHFLKALLCLLLVEILKLAEALDHVLATRVVIGSWRVVKAEVDTGWRLEPPQVLGGTAPRRLSFWQGLHSR